VLERHPALTGVGFDAGSASPDAPRMGEVRGWSLLQVAAFPTTLSDLSHELRSLLGAELPAGVGKVVNAGKRRVFKIGPESYWIMTPDPDELARTSRVVVSPEVGSVTSLSHSRACLFIEGSAAPAILAARIPLDFHPEVFGIDTFGLTGFHHVPVLVQRVAGNRYELLVMRTFALWVWQSLAEAAVSFGLSRDP
jgi:methylglutamate dehydrogenase subunit D